MHNVLKRASLIAALSIPAHAASSQVTPPKLRLVEDLRIDGETELLEPFRAILIARDGRVIVPQQGAAQLRIYNATGKFIGTFGRKGSGPGEFSNLFGTMGFHGDTLWIFEFDQRRVVWIGQNLKHLRTRSTVEASLNQARSGTASRRISMANAFVDYLYRDGTMLVRNAFGAEDMKTGERGDRRYIIVNAIGDVLRDVARIPASPERVIVETSSGRFARDVPFASQPMQAVAPDGTTIALISAATNSNGRGSYAVTSVRSTGDTVFSRSYTFAATPISRAVSDSAVVALNRRSIGATKDGRAASEVIAELARTRMPAFYAPVRAIQVGNDHAIWLLLHSGDKNKHYRILNGKGEPVGEVILPERAEFGAATHDQLWTIDRTEDGVPSIVRYRILWTQN